MQVTSFILYHDPMRCVLQRVSEASVTVEGVVVGRIGMGYLLLLCVMQGDTAQQVSKLAEKICGLRLFDGEDGKVNDRSLLDCQGGALVVSQFTLAADLRKGRRPDYTGAASPDEAKHLYEAFVSALHSLGVQTVQTGSFGAMMDVALRNDGPVTIFLDTTS
jgi:D-aminoacyl-tRNA deacylase